MGRISNTGNERFQNVLDIFNVNTATDAQLEAQVLSAANPKGLAGRTQFLKQVQKLGRQAQKEITNRTVSNAAQSVFESNREGLVSIFDEREKKLEESTILAEGRIRTALIEQSDSIKNDAREQSSKSQSNNLDLKKITPIAIIGIIAGIVLFG